MATNLQVRANKANARRSTGPKSCLGKRRASGNALNHGLCAQRVLVEYEDRNEFNALFKDMIKTLTPVGPVEKALVERVVVAIWRQRRLTLAEAATLSIDGRPEEISNSLDAMQNGPFTFGSRLDDLKPFDQNQKAWCEAVLAEFRALQELDLKQIEINAPSIYGQIERDAGNQAIDEFIAEYEGRIEGYVGELVRWCRRELHRAQQRPKLLALADQLRRKKLILPLDQLEIIARYQTTLDNQLYKALRALRDAQGWRAQRERFAADSCE